MENLKMLMQELAKQSSLDITKEVANLINKYCPCSAKMIVDDNGDTKVHFELSGPQLKYLMARIYEIINNGTNS